jgi:hypothetical protein
VFHVHYESASPAGAFRRGDPAIKTKLEALSANDDPLYWKTVNNGFIGTPSRQTSGGPALPPSWWSA